MKLHRLGFLLISLSALSIVSVEAKGRFDAIFVSDPNRELIFDASHIEDLHHFFVFNWEEGSVDLSETSTKGYELQRGRWVDGEFVPFDLLVYYPDQPNLIFYAGLLRADGYLCTSCSEYDQHWFEITSEAQVALNVVIADMEIRYHFRYALNSFFELLKRRTN